MVKIKLTKEQRQRVGEKIMDLGNIGAGSLLFGQAITGQPFSLRLAGMGVLLVIGAYIVAIWIMKGGGK